MGVNILLRAGVTPFERPSEFDVLGQNTIGNNSGNLLFAHAVYKHLSRDNVHIDVNRYRSHPNDADLINDKYDMFVIPLANAFRRGFVKQLRPLTKLISQLKIPCVVTGVGVQTDFKSGFDGIKDIEDDVKAFVSAILDKSSSIGVRGDYTNEYLRSLGFRDVETIGCPSFYLYGAQLNVVKKNKRPIAVSYNLTPRMPANVGSFFERLMIDYPDHSYVAQDKVDLELLLMDKPFSVGKFDKLPSNPLHPSLRNGNAMMFSDVSSWINKLKHFDFTVGTRIHGNIFSLHAGVPSFLIAHDTRTLELAEYLKIPFRRSSEVDDSTTLEELYLEADYSEMHSSQVNRFERYQSFLSRNGIKTIWEEEGAEEKFEAKLRSVPASDPILSLQFVNPELKLSRLHQSVIKLWEENTKLNSMVRELENKNTYLQKENKENITISTLLSRVYRTIRK